MMNSNNLCCCKGCNNQAVIKLLIRYVNKNGLFCESCFTELKKIGVVSVPEDLKMVRQVRAND